VAQTQGEKEEDDDENTESEEHKAQNPRIEKSPEVEDRRINREPMKKCRMKEPKKKQQQGHRRKG
jgi:hypothetical protein